MTKHLNVTREESASVWVDYEVNKFVAYLVLVGGSLIVFDTATEWKDIFHREEFQKYKFGWNLPVNCSQLVLKKRTDKLRYS